MYGSSLMSATRRPRLSSKQPIEEAARPLPRLETTPPVTKMYLGIGCSRSGSRFRDRRPHAFQINERVDTDGSTACFNYFDFHAVRERAQLFKRFGAFEFSLRPVCELQQHVASIDVQACVLAKEF